MPVENSTEGVVTHTLDNFMIPTTICGDVVLRIHQNLMVSGCNQTANITRIYSHAQSLAQCRKWLDAHYPNAERVALSSNSEAAKRIKSEWNAAAIAGEMAAELYGLTILADKIEDRPDNSHALFNNWQTQNGPSGDDKSSIMVSMRNEPGALHRFIRAIPATRFGFNPCGIAPVAHWPVELCVFIDFTGHRDDPNVAAALAEVSKRALDVKNTRLLPPTAFYKWWRAFNRYRPWPNWRLGG